MKWALPIRGIALNRKLNRLSIVPIFLDQGIHLALEFNIPTPIGLNHTLVLSKLIKRSKLREHIEDHHRIRKLW